MNEYRGRTVVCIILAIGVATAVNIIVIAVLYDAIFSEGPGLSDNATQILTGVFGGIIGVLGSYVGFIAGTAPSRDRPQSEPQSDSAAVTNDHPDTH